MESLASLLRLHGFVAGPESAAPRHMVAVIDDQPVSRTLIARLLKDLDDQLDVKLFVKALRKLESTRRTPIVLVTVLDDRQIRKRALEAGATDFLNKPIDHDECKARCRNLLDLSIYQAFLLDQLSIRNAYIRKLHQVSQPSSEPRGEQLLDVTEN